MNSPVVKVFERLALPPNGIDLGAEIEALRSARIRQALAQSGGDIAQAARLLRASPHDITRHQAALAAAGRIRGGVEFIDATAIRRYAAEGLSQSQIVARLNCNPYIVENVLQKDTDAAVRRLADEGRWDRDIAAALRLPLRDVRRILKRTARAALRAEPTEVEP